jgi:hypothetical protein
LSEIPVSNVIQGDCQHLFNHLITIPSAASSLTLHTDLFLGIPVYSKFFFVFMTRRKNAAFRRLFEVPEILEHWLIAKFSVNKNKNRPINFAHITIRLILVAHNDSHPINTWTCYKNDISIILK